MTQELILLQGLPGSGKTTWARQHCIENFWFRRVSKDDIRAMIGGEYSKPNEDTVIEIRNRIVDLLLDEDYSVVVDDTNLNTRHRVKLQNLCSKYGAEYRVMTFDTPLDECIARDAQRPQPVGEAVIRKMDEQWHGPRVSLDEMRKAMGM
jgi:predicted kinase